MVKATEKRPKDRAGSVRNSRKPWEQRDGESPQAFEAFSLYRSQGVKRSHVKVAHELGKSSTIVSRWSSRHGWIDRVRAYDAVISKEVVEDEKDAIVRMNRRHINESHKLQELVLQRIGKIRPEALSPTDVARWLDIAVKIERKCMGLDDNGPMVNTQVNVEVATEAHIILATKLYPKILTMLSEKQRAELDAYRKQLEEVASH
jgi:hypothetical protein